MTAAQEDVRTQSSLYVLLMRMYAKGELSGAQVHAIAKAGQEDSNKVHDSLQLVQDCSNPKSGKNIGFNDG